MRSFRSLCSNISTCLSQYLEKKVKLKMHEEVFSESDCESEDGDVVHASVNDISDELADLLYSEAGYSCTGFSSSELTVLPQPMHLTPHAEYLILEAKERLQIQFDLDTFQVQALLGI